MAVRYLTQRRTRRKRRRKGLPYGSKKRPRPKKPRPRRPSRGITPEGRLIIGAPLPKPPKKRKKAFPYKPSKRKITYGRESGI